MPAGTRRRRAIAAVSGAGYVGLMAGPGDDRPPVRRREPAFGPAGRRRRLLPGCRARCGRRAQPAGPRRRPARARAAPAAAAPVARVSRHQRRQATSAPSSATPVASHMPLDRAWMKDSFTASAHLLGRRGIEPARRCRRPRPAPMFSDQVLALRSGYPGAGERVREPAELRCWNSAPSAATPNVPPTMRLIERMPGRRAGLGSARPRSSRPWTSATSRSPCPRPMQHEGGQQHAVAAVHGDVGLHVERRRPRPAARRSSSRRGPTRSASRPAIGR